MPELALLFCKCFARWAHGHRWNAVYVVRFGGLMLGWSLCHL